MKQNKLFFGLATMFAAAFTFTACTSDDAESQSALQDRTIRLTSSVERGSTRATSDPQSGTSLSTSSSLGVFAINNSTALTNGSNEPYSVDGSGNLNPTTTANKMTWPASGNVSFYAYAPYAEGTTYNTAKAFSVQTDQTGDGYLASDLVVAKSENVAETSSAVSLGFKHLMSKINITIEKASGASVDLTHAKVSIINTNTATSFKLNAAETNEDPILGETSTPADITLFSGDGSAEPSTVVGVMVPQTIATGSGLVKIQTYPGNAANRTLIAKVDAATTFASGQQYSFTVTINDPEAPVTYITLKAGSTQLVAWNDNNLGAATKEYSIGDYILNDGSLLRASDADFDTKKANAIAVIFSNNVCENDASLGYDGYAVSIDGKLSTNNLAWSTSAGSVGTLKANLSDAIADYSGLSTKTTASADYTTYPVFQCTGAPEKTGTNLSDWFIPSVGQMVDIIQNLGEQSDIRSTITTEGASQSGNNNISIPTSISTFLPKINAYAVAVKGEGKVIITASGDGSSDGNCFQYVTSTEKDDSNMWMIKFPAADAANQRIYLSRAAGKTGTNNRNVLPIIAFKVK